MNISLTCANGSTFCLCNKLLGHSTLVCTVPTCFLKDGLGLWGSKENIFVGLTPCLPYLWGGISNSACLGPIVDGGEMMTSPLLGNQPLANCISARLHLPCPPHDSPAWAIPCWNISYREWWWLWVLCMLPQHVLPTCMAQFSLIDQITLRLALQVLHCCDTCPQPCSPNAC